MILPRCFAVFCDEQVIIIIVMAIIALHCAWASSAQQLTDMAGLLSRL